MRFRPEPRSPGRPMRINSISLVNFGVFRGRHHIDLKTTPQKPIILIGGKNGSGKSTLLEAVYVCLYGTQSTTIRTTRDQYSKYLDGHIHGSPSLLVQPTFASISIDFSYADLGRIHRYEVTRSWGRASNGRLSDRLDVKRDGISLGELGTEQWQDFIRELIPLGVSSLFFFDGEKIQHLAEDSTDQLELATSIKSLLGVNLVERLQADLSIFQSRLVRTNGNANDTKTLDAIELELSTAKSSVVNLEAERDRLNEALGVLGAQIGQLEQTIAAEGGGYAKRRDALVRKREEAKAKINAAEASIRQLCTGLLPFALASKLLSDLRSQIQNEQHVSSAAAGMAFAGRVRDVFADALSHDPSLGSKARESLRSRILTALDKSIAKAQDKHPTIKQVHSLSPAVSQQLLTWIELALGDIPRTASALGGELELAYRDLQKAEGELKKVPSDEILKPLLEQLNRANQEIGSATRGLSAIEESIRTASVKVAEIQRKRDLETDRLRRQAEAQEQLRLLPKLNTALGEFSEGLVAEKVRHLERELAFCFSVLLRKTDSVRRVKICPSTFEVTLYDAADAPLLKQSLSAGEKQIYAIAVLWALAKVSRRPLPLIIDTPLGRLDSDHRRLLVEGYFPAASHQVILLSTDTEIDHVYFDALRPYIASAYRLDFNMAERCTIVEAGYFEVN